MRPIGCDGEWVEMSEARGEVTIPDGLELGLWIDTRLDFDPRLLLTFEPKSLDVLEWVSTSKITDSSIRYIRHLAGLKGLALWESHIGDEGLVYIQELRNLEWLDIGDTRVSDNGLLNLRPLEFLRSLVLLNDRITDEGLVHLQCLTNLRSLDLMNTLITDRSVEVLSAMSLKDLRISNTLLTKDGYDRLRSALPDCRIRSDRVNEKADR